MNCHKIEQKILLANSGELSDRALEKLNEHVSSCRHCSEYRDSVSTIVSSARENLIDQDPRPATLALIREKAEKHHAPFILFRQPVVQVLAFAATIALVVSTWTMISSDSGTNLRINDLNAIMSMISEEDISEAEYVHDAEPDKELKKLADQLLYMEGLHIEELGNPELLPDV